MRRYELEATVVALERARQHAIAADLGHHFISEIDHLIATAKANFPTNNNNNNTERN